MCFFSRKFNDYNKKNLGFVLLCSISDNEMTKKKGGGGLHLKILLFSYIYIYIYRNQIVQNTAQLSSKGRFNQPPLFLIHWTFGSNWGG